ncbi:type II secretion system F family protein [Candidatus Woesearchaeota archaeon]|nr:type II secretion system F family protein [Candidatus Woesearchaeota archaeon]
MGFANELFEGVGKAFIFQRLRPKLKSYLSKAGIAEVPYFLIGSFFWISIIPVAYLFIYYIWEKILEKSSSPIIQFFLAVIAWSIVHLGILAAIAIAAYVYLDLKIFNRTKKMEEVLPDFLRLVSENLKGGMPFERSLWSAIKPEFGILGQEVRLAAKKVMTGTDVDEAIIEFTSKYDSPMLRRSFDLILEGMKGGGKIADVIDRVIDTIEETRELKAEMSATNLSYMIFVVVIVVVVAPGLFTLSFQFLTILQGLGERISSSGAQQAGAGMPINFGSVSVEPEKFKEFSRYALMVISVFASMIISLISKGSIKGGVKFIPLMFLGSQFVYAVAMKIGTSVFAGFFA